MTTTMVDNILDVYAHATDSEVISGKYWYSSANAICWGLDPVMPIRAAGVIAALSPRLHWDKNVAYARLAYNLKGYDITDIVNDTPGGNYLPVMKNSAIKAMAIVNGAHPRDILGGPKTKAFWDNISRPWDSAAVTVDKHAFDIAMNERTGYHTAAFNAKTYGIVAEAYRLAANELDLIPHQVQAITWEAWRNMNRGR